MAAFSGGFWAISWAVVIGFPQNLVRSTDTRVQIICENLGNSADQVRILQTRTWS